MLISSLIMICAMFSIFINKKYIKIYFLLVAILLSVAGFFYKPVIAADLYRHYEMLDKLRCYGLEYFEITKWDTLWIWNIYAYTISLMNNNGFLPAITIFIGYYCMFTTIHKAMIKFNLRKLDAIKAFIFFILCFNYVEILGGIRNMLAFCIFSHCIYIDLIENKNKIICMIVYLLLCFLHSSMFVFLLIRMSIFIKNRYIYRIISILLLCWSFFLPSILYMLNSLSNIDFFGLLLTQVQGYTQGGTEGILNLIIRTIILVCIIISIIYCRYNNSKIMEYNQYNEFVTMLILFTIGSLGVYDLYVRAISLVLMVCIIYILFISNNNRIYSKKINLMNLIFIYVSSIAFIFWSIYQYRDLSFYIL